MTTTTKQIRRTASKTRYHSRLGIIVAKELSDIFKRSPAGWVLLVFASLFFPTDLLIMHTMDYTPASSTYRLDPFMQNMDLRHGLTGLLVAPAIFMPQMLANTAMRLRKDVMEALLSTATRQWEFVFGRLLVFAIIWFGIASMMVMTLVVAARIPAFIELCPFLTYFHPTLVFFAQFVLAWTLGGCCLFAGYEYLMNCPSGGRTKLVTLTVILIVGALLPFPRAGMIPGWNIMAGLNAAFAHLPLDPRVQIRSAGIIREYSDQYAWAASVVGALITTLIFSVSTARGLIRELFSLDKAK